MTPQTARCYIAALVCVARIEAMKAANVEREQRGQSLAYGEDSFLAEADELSALAVQVINQ